MKTKLIQFSAIAAITLAGTLVAADQSPAPSPPPSSSPTDARNSTSSSSSDAKGSTSGSATATAASQFQGKITSVDKESKTVTIQDSSGNIHKLHIGETTKLSRGSTSSDSASWDDLQVGMEISGVQKMQGSKNQAETVTISSSTR